VAGSELGKGRLEGARVGVGEGIVGHDPLDPDAEAGEPGSGAGEEAGAARSALVGQQLRVGQARGVVDRHVQIFPAEPARPLAAVAGDPVPEAVDPAEFLAVDVQQLAGSVALVAQGRRLGVQGRQATESEPAQDGADGRHRPADSPRNARTGPTLAAQALDQGDGRGGQLVGRSGGRRAAIVEGALAARSIPRQPAVRGALRNPGGGRCIHHSPAVLPDPSDQKESTMDRHAGMFMDVHPRLPDQLFRSRNHSFNPTPRMNNLHSNHS
jgi:hypothetical protein